MSAVHTPGPWTLTHRGGGNFAVQTFEVRGMFGDSPNVYPIFNHDTDAIDGGVVHTSLANARLIAAAPELLDALEAFVDGDNGDSIDTRYENARQTIAKARGAA